MGFTDLSFSHGCQLIDKEIFFYITLHVSPWEVLTTGCWMPMAIKRGKVQLARYNVDANMDRHKRNLAQLQLLLLEMESQLLTISAMIDQLRSRWSLPGGLPVIR